MDSQENESNRISLPAPAFASLLIAVLGAGAGGYGLWGPQLDKQAVTAAIDAANTATEAARAATRVAESALVVATENARRINNQRDVIYDRTRNRYSAEEAVEDWRKQAERDNQQDRRLDAAERHIDNNQ